MFLKAIVLSFAAQATAAGDNVEPPRIETVSQALVAMKSSEADQNDPKFAQPLGNPWHWVRTGDYPPEAVRNEIEGIVGFILTISPAGVVTDCKISLSSGSALLDDKTCEVIPQRARFAPATDARGKAIVGSYTSRVYWTLPQERRKYEPMALVTSFLVSSDGTISDCRIERRDGAVAPDIPPIGPETCPKSYLPAEPFLDVNGQAIARRVRLTQKIETLAP